MKYSEEEVSKLLSAVERMKYITKEEKRKAKSSIKRHFRFGWDPEEFFLTVSKLNTQRKNRLKYLKRTGYFDLKSDK